MSYSNKIILHNGISMPLIGFGTYKIRGSDLISKCIEAALKSNCRSFDTASVYRNEKEIGAAFHQLLPKFNLNRSDIFLTSKLSPDDQGKEKCRKAFETSLQDLQIDYLDLYLIHWPGKQNLRADHPNNRVLREESWLELEDLYKEGKIKAIGVSNFSVEHLQSLLQKCSVIPHVNQVEFHPLYKQSKLIEFCRSKGIYVQAYSSLGTTSQKEVLLRHPIVQEVASSEGRSAAQVLLKWAVQQKIGVIPKSTDAQHIEENINLDFELSEKALQRLSNIEGEKKLGWDPSSVV